MSPRFLTLPDVAEILNVSVRQARTLVQRGDLRGIQVGGTGWRVEADELEAYIQRQYDQADRLVREQAEVDSAQPADHGDR